MMDESPDRKRQRVSYALRAKIADDGTVIEILDMFEVRPLSGDPNNRRWMRVAEGAAEDAAEGVAESDDESAAEGADFTDSDSTNDSTDSDIADNDIAAKDVADRGLANMKPETRWQYKVGDRVKIKNEDNVLLLMLEAQNGGLVACTKNILVKANLEYLNGPYALDNTKVHITDNACLVVSDVSDGEDVYYSVALNGENMPLPLTRIPVEIKVDFLSNCDHDAIAEYLKENRSLQGLGFLYNEMMRLKSIKNRPPHYYTFRNRSWPEMDKDDGGGVEPNLDVLHKAADKAGKLTVVDTLMNGNCFYQALAIAIMSVVRGQNTTTVDGTIYELRELTASVLEWDGYAPKLAPIPTPQEHANRVRRDSTMHADDAALAALERELRVKFLIFYNNKKPAKPTLSVLKNDILAEVPLNFVAVLYDPDIELPQKDGPIEYVSGHYRLLVHQNTAVFRFASLPPALQVAGAMVTEIDALACVPEFGSLAAQARRKYDKQQRADILQTLVNKMLGLEDVAAIDVKEKGVVVAERGLLNKLNEGWQYKVGSNIEINNADNVLLLLLDATTTEGGSKIFCTEDALVAANLAALDKMLTQETDKKITKSARLVVRDGAGGFYNVAVNEEDGPLTLDRVPVEIKVAFLEKCSPNAAEYLQDMRALMQLVGLNKEIQRLNSVTPRPDWHANFRSGTWAAASGLAASAAPNLLDVIKTASSKKAQLTVVETELTNYIIGDSFYDALAKALQSVAPRSSSSSAKAPEPTIDTLRAIVASVFESDKYVPPTMTPTASEVAAYARFVKQNHTYGADDAALSALERELRVKFFIFTNAKAPAKPTLRVIKNDILAEVPVNFMAVLYDAEADVQTPDGKTVHVSKYYRLLMHGETAVFNFASLPPALQAAGAMIINPIDALACVPEFASLAAQARKMFTEEKKRKGMLDAMVDHLMLLPAKTPLKHKLRAFFRRIAPQRKKADENTEEGAIGVQEKSEEFRQWLYEETPSEEQRMFDEAIGLRL